MDASRDVGFCQKRHSGSPLSFPVSGGGRFACQLQSIIIPSAVEHTGLSCFAHCRSMASVKFSLNCRLKDFESELFFFSGLTRIMVPRSIEVISDTCFAHC
jgi:hypothetical protein